MPICKDCKTFFNCTFKCTGSEKVDYETHTHCFCSKCLMPKSNYEEIRRHKCWLFFSKEELLISSL